MKELKYLMAHIDIVSSGRFTSWGADGGGASGWW